MNVDAHSQQFTIKLPGNPTTGYQWTVKQYDKAVLKLSSSQYIQPQTRRIGAGGVMTFTFSRVKGVTYPQTTIMLFSYARSWEPERGEMKEVKVHFK